MLANRRSRIVVTLFAALCLLLLFSSVAFAGGNDGKETKDGERAPVCVIGVVIDHREQPVDGTKTDPPLVIRALPLATNDNAVDATTEMTSTETMTDTVPVEPSQEMTPTQELAPDDSAALTLGFAAEVDDQGRFKFGLPAGTFDFALDLPDGWEGIVPQAERGDIARTGATELEESKKCYQIIFKIRRVFDVIVIKWEEGLDGYVTPGEGWKIYAEPENDPFVKPQHGTTDENGQAAFTLTAGYWIIKEEVMEDWKPVTPSAVRLHLDPYAQAGALEPVVFKNRKPACYSRIVVHKYGYGTTPQGEDIMLGPLAGWKVTVRRADNKAPSVTKTTDASGSANFNNLPPGVYKVWEQVQPGWEVVGDNPLTVVHMDCETTNVTFNNRETQGKLWIYGTKWYKPVKPPEKGGMVGLSGWEISAKLVGTDSIIYTKTDALGRYRFSEAELKNAGIGFPGATVEVCEEDREDWSNVTPECVKVTFPYPVPEAFDGVKVDFVNAQLCKDYWKGPYKQSDPWYGACKRHDGKDGHPPPSDDKHDYDKEKGKDGQVCDAVYKVVRGDTLAKIAHKYHTSVYTIARANHIKNIDLIYIGQHLCVK